MIAAEMLMGGGPLGAIAGVCASAVVAAGALWAMRRKIPHPTEFGCIGECVCVCIGSVLSHIPRSHYSPSSLYPRPGCCYLRGGCHTHEAVNLIVEVHQAENIPPGGNVYFYAEAGRFDCQTSGGTRNY